MRKKTAKKTTAKKAPHRKKTNGTCFVMIPFRPPFDILYERVIEAAIRDANLEPCRADNLFTATSIIEDIWKMIQESSVGLAVMTERNPNVFCELGLAHAVGKPVVLVTEDVRDIPFDLQGYRTIPYDREDPYWGESLALNIQNALLASVEDPISAVPSMFRKVVDSQSPITTEVEERLVRLERLQRLIPSVEPRGKKRAEFYFYRPANPTYQPFHDALADGCSVDAAAALARECRLTADHALRKSYALRGPEFARTLAHTMGLGKSANAVLEHFAKYLGDEDR